MYATDFEYDGKLLSDFGFFICGFGAESGVVNYDAGSKITFNNVSRSYGKYYSTAGATYDECVANEYTIAKCPDIFDKPDITDIEFRDLFRWLNRKEYLPFRLIDPNDPWSKPCYYDASFNVEKIVFGDSVCGLRLFLETNRPFGYGEEVSFTAEIPEGGDDFGFIDRSDEIGYIYPNVTIELGDIGDDTTLEIKNQMFPEDDVVIENCVSGETITIDGDIMSIHTDSASHQVTLPNDFNYSFFKIGNYFGERANQISVNLPSVFSFSYRPIIKNSP